ncbi:MAG: DUF4280 domain-containing protein [Lachnospiraceae bacterium]|nr:DUF4280 domain-containing protein [Lachnospiraceae bacterium]
MNEMSLTELENRQGEANMKFAAAYDAAVAAGENAAAAEQAYYDALNEFNASDITEESCKKLEEAKQAMEAAQKEAQDTADAMAQAAEEAQEAADAVNEKKEELRTNRDNDTTYVVHCARIECTYGMRESYLTLGPTHGVTTRQIPQMTVKDTVLNANIINFGGCFSLENPSVREAAEAAVAASQEIIEGRKNERKGIARFLDKVVDFFVKDTEVDVDESLMKQCVGECIAQYPVGTQWIKGHEKVTINGEPVLLRRCSLMCSYGGCITILVSGQPE